MQDDLFVCFFEFMTCKTLKSRSCDLFQRLILNMDIMFPYEHLSFLFTANILFTQKGFLFLLLFTGTFLNPSTHNL